MCSATKVFWGQKGLGGSGTTGPGVGEHQTGGLGAHRARADGKGWQLRAHLAEEAHLWEQSMVPQGSWLQWWVVLAGSWLCHQAAPLTLQLCLAEADKLTSPARWGSSGGCSEGLGSSHRLSRTSTGSTAAPSQVLGSQQGSYRSEAGSVPQLGKTPISTSRFLNTSEWEAVVHSGTHLPKARPCTSPHGIKMYQKTNKKSTSLT